jgi:hypothetical protein
MNEHIPAEPSDRITLRFKRAVQFPRFAMDAGELWDCLPYSKTGREYLDALRTGADRFPFAGGLCLVQDVEVVKL